MIPIYQPEITESEKKNVLACLDSTWISSKGAFIERFETNFAKFVGAKHAVGVCNGTAALHVALLALGIQAGDEVLVPALTYIASANAVKYCGATVRFVDVCPTTWQIDPEDVKRKLTPKTKAIMPVHLYGFPCDMEQIGAIAKQHNLFVIEDCAEAFGTRYKGQHVGTFGDVATFSFFGNKTISCGEGGMVVTNQTAISDTVRHLKGQGLAQDQEYIHDVLGYNYRLTNIQAAIGVAQLERAETTLNAKRQLAQNYKERLAHLPLTFPPEDKSCVNSYWMCAFLATDEAERDHIREQLKARQIETRPFFPSLHLMPYYSGKQGDLPIAESLSKRGLNVPSWPGLTQQHIALICATIEESFACRY